MAWYSEGTLTDPGDATVLADTGVLTAVIQFGVIIQVDAGSVIELVVRNSLNTNDVHVQPFNPSGTFQGTFPLTLVAQRLQLRLKTGITGTITATIFTGA